MLAHAYMQRYGKGEQRFESWRLTESVLISCTGHSGSVFVLNIQTYFKINKGELS